MNPVHSFHANARRCAAALAALLCSGWLLGCASYTTPGAGVSIASISKADADIGELLKAEPAASFPARMAMARVQGSGYASKTQQCYGHGRYCVVTARDVESEEQFSRLGRLPQIAGLAPMSRLLLPTDLGSLKDLRVAAAALKADLLLVYTLDTAFRVDDSGIAPLTLITLGVLPTKKAKVSTTASAVVFDVRTGFIFGIAEATATEQQRGSLWTTPEAIDAARLAAEKSAFQKLVEELEALWPRLVTAHAGAGKGG